MKISIFGLSVLWGGFWGIAAFYCVFLTYLGFTIPFKLVDELCFGFLSPSFFGAVLGSFLGFGMGFVTGIIGGGIYNFIAGFTE